MPLAPVPALVQRVTSFKEPSDGCIVPTLGHLAASSTVPPTVTSSEIPGLASGVHPRLRTTTSTQAFVITFLEIEYIGGDGPAIAALRQCGYRQIGPNDKVPFPASPWSLPLVDVLLKADWGC